MKIIYVILLFLISTISYSQISDAFYVEDVNSIEYVTVNFCVNESGLINDIKLLQKMTTYKNEMALEKITNYLKGFQYNSDSGMTNNCIDFTFLFINKKYKNSVLDESDYSKCTEFKIGKFKYKDVRFLDARLHRNKKIQREDSNDLKAKFKITWNNPCEYDIQFLKVKRKENQYLIGAIMKTKIIGLLSNSYMYKTVFKGVTIIGELERVK